MSTIAHVLRRYALLTALLFSLIAWSPAPSLASGWSAIASTCTLDDNAMLKPNGRIGIKYSFVGTAFQFQPKALSALNENAEPLPITVRCMVLNPYDVINNPAWERLIVTYSDPDGPGNGSRVVVKLIRTFRPNTSQTLATFDSNEHPPTAGATFVETSTFYDINGMDFSNSDYVVSINLYRTTRESNPRVARVRLSE